MAKKGSVKSTKAFRALGNKKKLAAEKEIAAKMYGSSPSKPAEPEMSYADRVKAAAKRAAGFGSDRAYISSVAREMGEPLESFKQKLTTLHRIGDIKLTRADLVGAMNRDHLNASATTHHGRAPGDFESPNFHFIATEGRAPHPEDSHPAEAAKIKPAAPPAPAPGHKAPDAATWSPHRAWAERAKETARRIGSSDAQRVAEAMGVDPHKGMSGFHAALKEAKRQGLVADEISGPKKAAKAKPAAPPAPAPGHKAPDEHDAIKAKAEEYHKAKRTIAKYNKMARAGLGATNMFVDPTGGLRAKASIAKATIARLDADFERMSPEHRQAFSAHRASLERPGKARTAAPAPSPSSIYPSDIVKTWGKPPDAPAKKGTPFITVEHKPDGTKEVKEHPSKKEAYAYGMARRRAGADVNAHSVDDARKFGLDPRYQKPKLVPAVAPKPVAIKPPAPGFEAPDQKMSKRALAEHLSASARSSQQHKAAAAAHREVMKGRGGDVRAKHGASAQAHEARAQTKARAEAATVSGVKRAGIRTPHALMRGKKGGTFYISNGHKIYVKKG